MTMLITIQSGEPITAETVHKVKDIFRESNCPNESLRNSIEGFKSLDDGVVQIGEGNKHTVEFDVITKI